jgi:hypothetical protein
MIDHRPTTYDLRPTTYDLSRPTTQDSPLYSTCLFCTKDLGTNEVIETLPIGRRLAFDAAQGRLWVVCRHCAKWNLVPFETRLESIDACERLFRDTRTRFSTDNIGLAKVGDGLELVRVGPALRPEFASWRYGEQYRRRRRNSYLVGGVGIAAAIGAVTALNAVGLGVVGSGSYMGWQLLKSGWESALNRRSRIMLADPATEEVLRLDRKGLEHVTVSWETGAPSLDIPRAKRENESVTTFRGADFHAAGRRVTGSLNMLLGSARDLREGTAILAEHSGDLTEWLRKRTEAQCRLGGVNSSWRYPGPNAPTVYSLYSSPYLLVDKMEPSAKLAIELWMNEDIERQWLEGELTLLEREWRQAEELAKIADGLAVPESVDEELAMRKG